MNRLSLLFLLVFFTLCSCATQSPEPAPKAFTTNDAHCAIRFHDSHERRPREDGAPRPHPADGRIGRSYTADFMPSMKNHFDTGIEFYCREWMPLGKYEADMRRDSLPEVQLRRYPLQGKNWKGVAFTYYDSTGEDTNRSLSLGFYIPKIDGEHVITGEATPVGFKGSRKKDVIQEVINLLNSIEFVDVTPRAAVPDTK